MTPEQIEARLGPPDPNNPENLTARMAKVQVAMDGVVDKFDNLGEYMKRTGVFDAIVQEVLRLAVLPTKPAEVPASTPAPVVTGPTMPGLSADQIEGVLTTTKAALIALPNNFPTQRARIIETLKANPPTYDTTGTDPDFIEAVRELYYPAGTDKNVYAYLQIVDQRDEDEKPLPPNDKRWKRVVEGSTVPVANVPANVSGDLFSQLTALGFEFYNGRIKGVKLRSPGPDKEGDAFGYLGMDDGALRAFYNIVVKIGSVWPDYETNPNLPVIMGPVVERDGGISRDLIGSGKRKTHVTYLAGRIKGGEARTAANVGKWVDEVYWEDGRGVRFSVMLPGGNPLGDILPTLALDAKGVIVRAGDQLRRLVVGADGRPDFGEVVDENE